MKKVINGKLYDTEKAKRLGEYEPNPYRSDFNWFCETLYQKRTGEFFLYGNGNAASKYSKSCGQNEWCGSEKIIPISYEEAQEWAEQHLAGDEYIEIFGEPDEDTEKERINIKVNAKTAAKIRQEAAKAGITIGEYIEDIVSKA